MTTPVNGNVAQATVNAVTNNGQNGLGQGTAAVIGAVAPAIINGVTSVMNNNNATPIYTYTHTVVQNNTANTTTTTTQHSVLPIEVLGKGVWYVVGGVCAVMAVNYFTKR